MNRRRIERAGEGTQGPRPFRFEAQPGTRRTELGSGISPFGVQNGLLINSLAPWSLQPALEGNDRVTVRMGDEYLHAAIHTDIDV